MYTLQLYKILTGSDTPDFMGYYDNYLKGYIYIDTFKTDKFEDLLYILWKYSVDFNLINNFNLDDKEFLKNCHSEYLCNIIKDNGLYVNLKSIDLRETWYKYVTYNYDNSNRTILKLKSRWKPRQSKRHYHYSMKHKHHFKQQFQEYENGILIKKEYPEYNIHIPKSSLIKEISDDYWSFYENYQTRKDNVWKNKKIKHQYQKNKHYRNYRMLNEKYMQDEEMDDLLDFFCDDLKEDE